MRRPLFARAVKTRVVVARSRAGGHIMGYTTLLLERAGAIATLTLNRPDARNALDLVMRGELLSALDEVEADPEARVVILTGAGGHFCAGGDVKTMRTKGRTAADGRRRVESLNRMVQRLVEFPRPTIPQVDGFAVGAGCNLPPCCDPIGAADPAHFGGGFRTTGLWPALSTRRRARRRLPSRAKTTRRAWPPSSRSARRGLPGPSSGGARPARTSSEGPPAGGPTRGPVASASRTAGAASAGTYPPAPASSAGSRR